jgi:transketolase
VSKGAYIIKKEEARLDAVLISTGIDLTTTYLIKEELKAKGYDTRLVSMPSVELFLDQPQEYQDEIIPPTAKVFTIEASATLPWYRFASKGCAIGIDTFGASGKKEDVLEKLHFDYETILSKIETNIKGQTQ